MSGGEGRLVATGENPDLKAMHRNLVALVRRLELSVDEVSNAAALALIADQIVEANARAVTASRTLLVAQTEEIALHARAVSDAIPEVSGG